MTRATRVSIRLSAATIVLAILASAGPAGAYCVYSTPDGSRLQWPAATAISLNIDPAGADAISQVIVSNLMVAMANNWSTASATPRWTYALSFGTGNPFHQDGINLLGFRDLSVLGYSPDTYATTLIWYVSGGVSDGTITEVGIALNTDAARVWTWVTAPTLDTQVDIGSIAMHELGHALGLAHSNPDGLGACAEGLAFADTGPVMQPIYSRFVATNPDRRNRVLTADDIAGNTLPAVGENLKGTPPATAEIEWRLRRGDIGQGLLRTPGSSYLIYPGACNEVYGGTWAAKPAPASDNLDSYGAGTTGDYVPGDLASPGVDADWRIVPGNFLPTADMCSPAKALAGDHMFYDGDQVALLTVPGSSHSLATCAFPVPAGTASLVARWNQYEDMPRGSGWIQRAEYRFLKGGVWYPWRNMAPAGDVRTGAARAWSQRTYELAEAAQATKVQLRFQFECAPFLAADHLNCEALPIGLLYDDFEIEAIPGAPPPVFGIFPGSLAQSTFVDGTIKGDNCTVIPCWPGIRGTQNGTPSAIDDNFNSPLGDSITVTILSGLGVNGNGVNWLSAFDKTFAGGMVMVHINPAFAPGFGAPEVFFRLFDPTTKTWSPWDDSVLDGDDVQIVLGVPVVMGSRYRWDWPPRDKVAAGAALPGGFTINGVAAYAALSFLPRGTRMQYFFRGVDAAGGTTYAYSSDLPGYEVEDIPILPAGVVPAGRAPDILEFDVLPRVYPPGAAGTLLAGKTRTPVLNLDGAYGTWSFRQDPVTVALRGLGVRADRYRLLQGLGEGANIGGHELPGQRIDLPSNYFPNWLEYPLVDSLATWYRIIIQSGHLSGDWTVLDEQDASLLDQWLNRDTGTNGGDRCVLITGDDVFDNLLNPRPGMPGASQAALAQNRFGVQSAIPAWTGTIATPYPVINDRFSDPAAGPGLGVVGAYTFPVDGGCAGPNRFDGLTAVASPDAFSTATYPGGVPEVAAVARMSELDALADNDRTKALGYAFSFQFIRKAGIPPNTPPYPHSGVGQRAQVLFKFLTGCRGATNGVVPQCWPCPSGAVVPGLAAGMNRANQAVQVSNWATDPAFQTATYGPLYPIQDPSVATSVEPPSTPPAAPRFNALLQNRPNPFNPTTVIPYSLAAPGRVSIRIYDVSGRLVRVLTEGMMPAGDHEATWNGVSDGGTRAASGVYFYRITYPDGSSSAKRMMMLK